MKNQNREITNREFFELVKNGITNEIVIEHATKEIEKLNRRNAKRASKPTKTQLENEPLKAEILEIITEKGLFASQIGEIMNITTQKASALARQLVTENKLNVTDAKVKGKGVQKLYTRLEQE